tara:strand:+ start:1208 stop:1708 length:501 start_codon:yes stop_codon:yes gene_type:complete
MILHLDNKEKTFHRPANPGDAGYDLNANGDPVIVGKKGPSGLYSSIDYIEYDTNVKISPENNEIYTFLFPRSSISEHNLMLANGVGVIDSGYRNSIKARFKYIIQPSDIVMRNKKIYVKINKNKIYKNGDKIAQLLFAYHVHPQIVPIEGLDRSVRGFAGFGSSGA